MTTIRVSAWLISTVATVALVTGATAQTVSNERILTPQEAAQMLSEAEKDARIYRKWTVAEPGMYAVHAPANAGLQISINGQLIVDASGTRMQEVGQEITGILSLQAGDHAIVIRGLVPDHPVLGRITVNAVGANRQPLLDGTAALTGQEAGEILAARASLDPAGAPATVAGGGNNLTAAPFSIGGSSSTGSILEAANQTKGNGQPRMVIEEQIQTASAMSSTSRSGGGSSGSDMSSVVTSAARISDLTGAGEATNASTDGQRGLSTSLGRLGSIGRAPNIGTGFGQSTETSGGGNGGGGGVTVTPPPPPPPPPTEAVVISPLMPPESVTLTQAIALTAAGNDDGQVLNTGATLFGAVMEGQMYDEINVVISPVGRETTVDVGSETGQFAVRLFEEDFANGSAITVTLTGGSSASDEIASEPVSYDLTGFDPTDGATQAMSRLTFGASPALYARLRGIGFEAFVEEQLNPDQINDSVFMATRPQDLLNRTTNNRGEMFRSLMAYEIAYATFSRRQLKEVMGHFWANHFHAVNKDSNINQQAIDDRQFFRDNAFGNFEDMLLYSARSPLMSQYLDNDQNRAGNINENYGREIMELFTVGVDGGYSEEDVIEASRIFTGWAYERTNPNQNNVAAEYVFQFFPERHDAGDKVFDLEGITIAGRSGEDGVLEGEEFIAILSQLPQTRNFICGKIVQLLVADVPPQRFIDSCAAAWEATGGDVEPMLRAILLDPAYIETVEYQRTKVKTPFEYAISALRAFGAEPGDEPDYYRDVREAFEEAGYAMLYFEDPTGLPEVGSAWVSSASMIEAFNEISDVAERRENYGIDLLADINDAGLETAEEVAAFLLTIATADRFTEEEFDAVITALRREDGIFDPRNVEEDRALERAMGMIVVSPSFQLQ